MNRKLKIKLVLIALLTALIGGSLLATGSDGPASAASHQTTWGAR